MQSLVSRENKILDYDLRFYKDLLPSRLIKTVTFMIPSFQTPGKYPK